EYWGNVLTEPTLAGSVTALGGTLALKAAARADHVYDVRDYGAVGDGSTDASTAIQAAINAAAGGGTVFFPKGTYRWNPSGSSPVVLSADLSIVGEAGTILQLDAVFSLAASSADASLSLASNVARGDRTMTVDDASSLAGGDVVNITTTVNIGPGTKMECLVIRSVSGNTLTFETPLNLSYSPSDTGLTIEAYRKRRLTVSNLHFRANSVGHSQFRYFNGLRFDNCTFSNREDTGTNNLLLACANVYAVNTTFLGGMYGTEVARCRGVHFQGVFASEIGAYGGGTIIAPGYGTVGLWVEDVVSRGCWSSTDSHFAFDVGYENIDANDFGDFNLRGLGKCHLRNARLFTTSPGNGNVSYVGQPTIITSGDAESIYDSTDIVFENVQWITPNIDGKDPDDFIAFHFGNNAILRNVEAYHLHFYAVPTYHGFANVQITDSRLGKVQFSGGQRALISNTLFESPVSGDDASDWAMTIVSPDAMVASGCVFKNYTAVAANYSTAPVYWTGCTFDNCTNFADTVRGAGTACVNIFTGCRFNDIGTISATEVTNNATAINCLFSGSTTPFYTGHTLKELTCGVDGVTRGT
ncbi:MAG TPA: glycosyl hydrolase family 28-related protein, partial [Candidatus Hydrogenedentes bacterium]|nr:glycosyl hydrolase family 28-related protein [Candidatus Hydrogenedentota bacterium]